MIWIHTTPGIACGHPQKGRKLARMLQTGRKYCFAWWQNPFKSLSVPSHSHSHSLFVSQSFCLSVSGSLSLCLSVYVSLWLSVTVSLFLCFSVSLSLSLSLSVSLCLSVSLSLCPLHIWQSRPHFNIKTVRVCIYPQYNKLCGPETFFSLRPVTSDMLRFKWSDCNRNMIINNPNYI